MIGNYAGLMFFECSRLKKTGEVERLQFRNVDRLLEYSDQQDACMMVSVVDLLYVFGRSLFIRMSFPTKVSSVAEPNMGISCWSDRPRM